MTLTQIKPAGLSKPVDLADNERIRLGTGNDLQIYHNGVDTYLEGSLRIGKNNNVRITDGDDNTIIRIDASSAYLAYEGNDKLQTTSTGVSIPGILQMGTSSSYIDLPDNASLYCGTGDDLRIYHDGSHSYIKNTTGHLRIGDANVVIMNAACDEEMIHAKQNEGVELYYDNSKKFETTSYGIDVTGSIHSNGDLLLNDDNQKILIGGGNDLQIFHNGTHSFISNTTGNLQIDSDQFVQVNATSFRVKNAGDTELIATFTENGAVELYYDHSVKFKTDSAGCEITGALIIPDGSASGNRISVGNAGDLKIYHDGSDSIIKQTGTGGLILESAVTNEHTLVKAGVNGDFRAYVNNGTLALICNAATQNAELRCGGSKRLATQSGSYDGVKVHGNASNVSVSMQTEDTTRGTIYANSSNQVGFLDTGGDWAIKHTNDSQTEFYVQTNRKVAIDADGLKFNNDTAVGNALDDYEYGTWTPTFPYNGTGNQALGTYLAEYTKIGRFVYAFLYANITGSPQSNSTQWTIGGLPFNANYSGVTHHGFGNVTYVGSKSYSQWRPLITSNSTVYFHRTDGNNNVLRNSDVVSEGMNYWIMGLNYMVST